MVTVAGSSARQSQEYSRNVAMQARPGALRAGGLESPAEAPPGGRVDARLHRSGQSDEGRGFGVAISIGAPWHSTVPSPALVTSTVASQVLQTYRLPSWFAISGRPS